MEMTEGTVLIIEVSLQLSDFYTVPKKQAILCRYTVVACKQHMTGVVANESTYRWPEQSWCPPYLG